MGPYSRAAASAARSLSIALAITLIGAGCDCSGATTGDPCTSDGDCPTGQSCMDGLCAPRMDAGGMPGDDGGPARDAGGGARDAATPAEDAGPCRSVSAESTVEPIPVDIIVVIDNSGSMTEEAAEVQRNINDFAAIIGASGLDYRVILISDRDTSRNGVCVPAPLGSGPPDCTSGPEGRLRAVHQRVGSTNGPSLKLSTYPMWSDFLRFEAAKVFLWITDDESAMASDAIRSGLDALEPAGMFSRTIHNAIVGYYGDTPDTWATRGAGSCPSLARPGVRYLRLTNCLRDDGTAIADCTSGLSARVCETDWTPIFMDIARGVVAGVPVVCEFAVPDPPEGFTLDLDMIRVTWRSGDVLRMELRRVPDAAVCSDDGWYFDDPSAPTLIVLCPDLCRAVQADPDARLDVALGCFPLLM